jgi:AcrR family transcriptional regulator
MARGPRVALKPRKVPAQSRSKITVDAIFEATIQVLIADGLQRLTTTRVAERAGVSVGTLYQYYPNKQSLLFVVLERHLRRISQSMESAARDSHHKPLKVMVRHVVIAFVAAKTANLDESRALYAVASEIDSVELVVEAGNRINASLAAMLATAADRKIKDPMLTAFYLFSAMVGPARAMLEGGAAASMLQTLAGHLERLCMGYLDAAVRYRRR